MPVVSEMVHPKGFDFATQRKIVILRTVQKMAWKDVAKEVRNLQGKKPRPRHCANYFRDFNKRLGRRKMKYENCGLRPYKVTPEVERFLVRRLRTLRRTSPCTSVTLQQELAREMKVDLAADYIRKILGEHGYKWLPRRQKRLYSAKARGARLKFAMHVLGLSEAELRRKLSMAMDGTVLAMPPTDPTERLNYCRHGEEFMWRKPSESFRAELAGDDPYRTQLPLSRAVPLWGGISADGFAVVAFHPAKKFNAADWAWLVDGSKLKDAIQKLNPANRHGPWHLLCDNERFLTAKVSTQAHKKFGIKLWQIPSRSPDLNPIERFWGWLKKKLRRMDLTDAVRGRKLLSKTAYKQRVRQVLSSKKAQQVASSQANTLRKVCKAVAKAKGAATGF